MQQIGRSKIGSLSARKGMSYPQLRLPRTCIDAIGKTVNIFETESDGKRAFLMVIEEPMLSGDNVLKRGVDVLKQCTDVAQCFEQVRTVNIPDYGEQLDTEESPNSPQKPLLSIHRLVSCALCSHRLRTRPGSVAAYHGALSRLRLGFKSRLGRLFFAFF